ncbi:hypothetical protein ACH4GG_27335 [Streptomyces albidoflavus]|uniref:hypothetical protein n=1 Tax=Streptomyces albidoflavus TaxID=1886 RepID=UPI00101E6E99|nr:hypothetical protein [Streptomyces albidoflavus]RZE18391.1 hypothetical protein C0Q96_28855 [Streptomyces albidoflavus]
MKRSRPTPSPNSTGRLIEQVRRSLGFPAGWAPRADLGETATSLQVWSPAELDDLFSRVGGQVALQQTGRTVAVTLTTPVPGAEPVVVTTEWEPDVHPEHLRLPVLQAALVPMGGA